MQILTVIVVVNGRGVAAESTSCMPARYRQYRYSTCCLLMLQLLMLGDDAAAALDAALDFPFWTPKAGPQTLIWLFLCLLLLLLSVL